MGILELFFATFAVIPTAAATAELGWKFEYDKDGRISKTIDPAGLAAQFQYDYDKVGLRRLVRQTADGTQVTQEFDEAQRRILMTDGQGTVAYGYDDWGRLNRIQRQGGPGITYDYDTQNRITRLQVGDFYNIEYGYDFLGRLAYLKTPVGAIEYEYQAGQGKVIRKLPNGVWTISSYAPNGELQQIQHGHVSNISETSYTMLALADYTYQYRPDGLIEAIGEGSHDGQYSAVYKYEYDKVGRLVNITGLDQQYHYEYDLVGNRLQASAINQTPQTAACDWMGRMTELNGKPVGHDAAGNLATLSLGAEILSYHYNPDNQLAAVGDGKVTYRYDGEGRLIARKVGEVPETTFIADPLSPYWQPLIMDSTDEGRTLVVWEGSTPLMLIKDGKPEYLLHDHLGSVRFVADAQGQVTQRFDYEPFGSLVNPEAATEFAPRFAGLFWDAEAKAYLTLARGYRPDLGRFMGVEPERRLPRGSQNGLSTYQCSGNDSVNFVDRDGREPKQFNDRSHGFLVNNLWHEAIGLTRTTAEDLVFEYLENRSEASGQRFAGIRNAVGLLELLIGSMDSLHYILEHPGEPASEWRAASTGLNAYSFVGGIYKWGMLLPKAASGIGTLIAIAQPVGEGIRSRILQDRAERLAYFGGAILEPPTRMHREFDKYQGYFSASNDRSSIRGRWELYNPYTGWLNKTSQSLLRVTSTVDRPTITIDDSLISGVFRRAEIREEKGGNLFNFYEPSSTTIHRYKHDYYTITRNGGRVIDETHYYRSQSVTPSQVRGVYPGKPAIKAEGNYSPLPKKVKNT